MVEHQSQKECNEDMTTLRRRVEEKVFIVDRRERRARGIRKSADGRNMASREERWEGEKRGRRERLP